MINENDDPQKEWNIAAEKALKLIVSAIKKSGFINGRDVSICLDVAANELYMKKKIFYSFQIFYFCW